MVVGKLVPSPTQTSVKFCNFLDPSPINLVSYFILRPSFHVDGNLLTALNQKLKKNVELSATGYPSDKQGKHSWSPEL